MRRWRWWAVAAVVAAAIATWWVAADGNWPAPAQVARTSSDSLTLTFHVSYGANLFYVVDQISRWDPHTRTYYQDYWKKRFGATRQDLRTLEDYCVVRAQYPWGKLEPVFYAGGDGRAARARLNKVAPGVDARTGMRALEQFRPEFDQVWAEADYLHEMTERLAAGVTAEHKRSFDEAARLFGAQAVSLDVLAMWSPEPLAGGGGFNGGRIALEMPRGRPIERVLAVMFHEALHAFQEPRESQLDAFAQEHDMPSGVMHEAVLYAIAPGVFARRHGHTDPLPGQIAEMEAQDISPEDELYQIRKLALALEPVTDDYLRSGRTLEEYLPRVADAWQGLLRSDAYLAQLLQLAGRPAGAGMVLEPRDGRLAVVSFDPGAPAQAVGVRIGDEITEVRGKPLADWQREGVSPRKVGWRELRGQIGEPVELTVMRGDELLHFRVLLAIVGRPDEPPSEPQALALCRRRVAEALNDRLQLYLDAFGPEFMAERLADIERKPFIIAMSPDEVTIPRRFRHLLPIDYDELMARLARGETVTATQERPAGPVLLLAAPRQRRLLEVIRQHDFSAVLAAVYAPPPPGEQPARPAPTPAASQQR
ncbi:MAG: S41 family peptidase [Armatimonadota bacterium]